MPTDNKVLRNLFDVIPDVNCSHPDYCVSSIGSGRTLSASRHLKQPVTSASRSIWVSVIALAHLVA